MIFLDLVVNILSLQRIAVFQIVPTYNTGGSSDEEKLTNEDVTKPKHISGTCIGQFWWVFTFRQELTDV